MYGAIIFNLAIGCLIGMCLSVYGDARIDQERIKSVRELIERFETATKAKECRPVSSLTEPKLSTVEATTKLLELVKNQDLNDRCIRLHLLTMFLNDGGGTSSTIVKTIAEQEILKTDAPASLENRLAQLREYIQQDAKGGSVEMVDAEIDNCLNAARQQQQQQQQFNCPKLQEHDDGVINKDEIYSEAFKMMSDLNDLMERVDNSKRMMQNGEVPFHRWIDLLMLMREKLENAPDTIPSSYEAFLARQLSDLNQMNHCNKLMEDVIKLEEDGMVDETAFIDWNSLISKIIRNSSSRYGCPPGVQSFLDDERRCAKSELREKFVNHAIELARAKNRLQIERARYQIITTIHNCQRDNIPMPAWYPKLYYTIVP